ncbi:TniQ family protein [Glycomyces sp. MUSA5-2]|uniref:TniQ family protein n=1 Tax=Glycomyces sp. MUSA5-2 TaxID=2053002 RepID=UPI0030084D7A
MTRRLAVLVEPAPGEAFYSWLVRLGDFLQIPVGHLPRLLGLECASYEPVRPRYFGITLTAASRAELTAATGLGAAAIDAMHLTAFHGTVLDLHDITAAMDQSHYAAQSFKRACPDCLAESGGVWQLWWQLAFAAVCPRHRLLLHDRCPACHTRFGSYGYRGDFGWDLYGITLHRGFLPDPMQCGTSRFEPHRCNFPLEDLARIRVPEFLVEAQRRYLDALAPRKAALGGVRLPPFDWYRIVHKIAAVYYTLAPYLHIPRFGELPTAVQHRYGQVAHEKISDFGWSRHFSPPALYDRQSGLPRWLERGRLHPHPPFNASEAAALLCLLHPLLAADDRRQFLQALRRFHRAGRVFLRARNPPQDLPELFRRDWDDIARSPGRYTPFGLLQEPIGHPGPLGEAT